MKANSKIRYAIRMLLILAKSNTSMNASLLANIMNVSPKYIRKISGALEKKKLIVGIQGIYGGYKIAKNPSKIKIKDIFDAYGLDISLTDCTKNKSCKLINDCPASEVWNYLYSLIEEKFYSLTLQDIIDKNYLKKMGKRKNSSPS